MVLITRNKSSIASIVSSPVKRKYKYGVRLQAAARRSSLSTQSDDSQRPPDSPCPAPASTAEPGDDANEEEQGAMTRRLADLRSSANLSSGGRGAQGEVEEAGFSQDVKNQLLERISSGGGDSSRAQHPSAFAQADMSASAPKQAREAAGAAAWTGVESVPDAALRMLSDARKPVRVPFRTPNPQRPPNRVDTGRPSKSGGSGSGSGVRLANARDKTSMYSYLQDPNLSDRERERMRKELKERFTPAARPMPTTLQGLASLANERIEDAIAR